jgi:hypothetical protein
MNAATRGDRGGLAVDGSVATGLVILACLVAAILASLWSLKTTYLGMNLIFKDSAGALVFASIIQVWLLGVSLVLGSILAQRFLDLHARKTGALSTFLWMSFAITLIISMFFSYVNYLTNTFGSGQDELSDRGTATALVQKIIPGLEEAVGAQKKASIEDFLRQPAVAAWKLDMDKVQKAASDPESKEVVAKATAEAFRASEENRAKVQQARGEADTAKAAMPGLRAERDEKQAKIDVLEKQLKEAEGKKAEATDRRKTAEKLRDNELKGNTSVIGQGGRGSRFTEFQKQAGDALKQERAFGLQIVTLTSDLLGPRRELADVVARVKSADEKISAAAQLDVAANAVRPVPPTATGAAASGSTEDMQVAIRDFSSDPQQATFSKVVSTCNSTRSALSSIPATVQSVNIRNAVALACTQTDVAARVKTRTEDEWTQFATFAKTCSTASANDALKEAPTGDAAGLRDGGRTDRLLKRAQAYTQQCLNSAPKISSTLRESLQATLNQFVESNDVGTDQLKLALLGFSRAPIHALLSAIFALLQDVFVLIAGIGAEYVRSRAKLGNIVDNTSTPDGVVRAHDDPSVAACKIILQLAKQEPGSQATYLVRMNSPEWSAQESLHGPNMRMLLMSLSARHKAKLVNHEGSPAYRIDRFGYQDIVNTLNAAELRAPEQRTTAKASNHVQSQAAASQPASAAASVGRSRTRQQILAEMLGRPDQPLDGASLVSSPAARSTSPDGRTSPPRETIEQTTSSYTSNEPVRPSQGATSRPVSRQALLDRLLRTTPSRDAK